MNNLKRIALVYVILLGYIFNVAHAEDTKSINLIIRDEGDIIFENSTPLRPTGTIELNGHPLDADSVLSVLNDADIADESWSITDLQYFESFGSFYVKCINNKCDNWQYVVDDASPGVGMDQKILSGGEEIYVYFSPQHRIILSSNSITTAESVTVIAENYDYRNNNWELLQGVIIGLTQPNPSDPFSPIELQTLTVNDSGQAIFSNIASGSYNIGIKEDFYFPTETLTVIDPPEPGPSSSSSDSGSGSRRSSRPSGSVGTNYNSENSKGSVLGAETKKEFDVEKAVEFLLSQQKENGSFGEEIYTDWATIALMSANSENQKLAPMVKLVKHFGESEMKGSLLTDFERHAMALMSLGLNPYNTNGENYVEKITASFDGKQFGDINEDNDDIFALIVLKNAGFTETDPMILSSINFILGRQKENGSWDESVDMTGASVQTLTSFAQNEQIKKALAKAKEFLKQSQKNTGGWGNVSSTAWAMGGITALGEKREDWEKGDKTPLDYLAEFQEADGGIKNEYLQNRIWETAYVLTALSGKTWGQIMQKFDKPVANITLEEKEALEQKLERVLALLEEIKTENKTIKLALAKNTATESSQNVAKTENTEKENKTVKTENSPIQNTATVINALEENKNKQTEKGWFANLLSKIFSF